MHRRVLYLTRNGALEPLGQSQIVPYLKLLADYFSIVLISFEKSADWLEQGSCSRLQHKLYQSTIIWFPLRFRAKPRPFAPVLAILQLVIAALWQWTRRSPSLVHARSYVPAAVALLLHKLTGVPFIFDMRALWPEELITAGNLRRNSCIHRTLLWLERRCLQEASGVVSLTHAAVVHLQACYPRELAGQRIVVIPTCADLQRFHPGSPRTHDLLVVGCIGTVLSGWFRVDWLRAFFEAVSRADPRARFELISRDSPEAILNSLNPALAWSDRLHIASARSEQMPAILRRHTASVMFFTGGLSKLGSSPTRMAEVLACGLPVVANPGVGDVEQIMRQNRIGVLARGSSPSEMDACVTELLDLLKDRRLSQRCRRTAESLFSLEAGTAAYRQLYTDILS
jgi:glycosyltransferase involved in cell wall biosynthesis